MSASASQSTPSPTTTANRFLPLLLVLFLGSGCAALIYEIVWLQMLQLVIGSTAVSLGVLLGTFMGGMCLGSLLLPRIVSSRVHPLIVYAVLEIGIALCGLAISYGLHYVEGIYASIGSGAWNVWLRGVVATICLLPPTILMGATLPAVARWVESTPQGVSWLGFFYGGNILGAVVGCLLAGFYLLPETDMARATWVAVAINATVAALGLAITVLHSAMSPDGHRPAPSASIDAASHRIGDAWPVYIAIGLSGLCALGAEVVWTRILSLTFGGTVYTFSLILSIFLMGLGIGSSVGAMIGRSVPSPRGALGICQLLLACAIAWAAYVTSKSLPFWPVNPELDVTQWFTFQLDMARTAWAVLPAACLWGASFPLALAAAAGPGRDPGRLVGGLYAVNTVGAIVGSLAFSMWLIPNMADHELTKLLASKEIHLGTERSQQFLILLSFIAGMIALLPIGRTSSADETSRDRAAGGSMNLDKFAWWVAGAAIGGYALVSLITVVKPIPWGLVAYGRFMPTYVDEKVNELALADGVVSEGDVTKLYQEKLSARDKSKTKSFDPPVPTRYLRYVGEGLNVSVAVTEDTTHIRSFHGSGKVQASSDPADMRLQRMLGHIPALAFKNPKDGSAAKTVLVVACGAGVTAGSFIPHPEVEEIVICDIEPLVPQFVTPFFSKENFNIVGRYENGKVVDKQFLDSGRVKLVYDDGRHYIHTLPKGKMFDIITSDPIDPWVKGTAALNTVEYYQMCRDHLNPGGVMALWMPIYESNLESLKSAIATFFEVFPHGILWTNDVNNEGYDAILFGQVEPTRINLDEVNERLQRADQKPVADSMREVGYRSIYELFGTYGGDAQRMKAWTKDAEINTDRNLRLQYLAGKALNNYKGKALLEDILKYYEFPSDIFSGSDESIEKLQDELAKHGRH